jgi:predicted transcriptional regulator
MKLAAYLSEQNKTASAFAAEIDVPASTITRLLRGERAPGIALVSKIIAKTDGNVTIQDLMPSSPDPVDDAAREAVEQAGEAA